MARIQKIIAQSGYCSRRKAELLIKEGVVLVNGKKTTIGDQATITDEIKINGKSLFKKEPLVYFLLNKPKQTISSASDDKGRKCVVDLIKTKFRIYPVGRLDYDTTGALLLTNDGELVNYLIHPSNVVWKKYIAIIKGKITLNSIKQLCKGVMIANNYQTAPAKVKLLNYDKKKNRSKITIKISEGKKHQIKLMFQTVGHLVHKLHRESFSILTIKKLGSGRYLQLTDSEINYFKKIILYYK